MTDAASKLALPKPATHVRSVLGPRPAVVLAAGAVMVGVVLVLGYLISSSQDSSRRAAEQRFASGATIHSQLTSSLLATSGAALRSSAAKVPPTRLALDALVKSSHLGYAAIISANGTVVASSSRAPGSRGQASRGATGVRPPGAFGTALAVWSPAGRRWETSEDRLGRIVCDTSRVVVCS